MRTGVSPTSSERIGARAVTSAKSITSRSGFWSTKSRYLRRPSALTVKASSEPISSRVTAEMRVARGPLGGSLATVATGGGAGATVPVTAGSTGAGAEAAAAAAAGAGSEPARLAGRSKIKFSDLSFEKIW